MADHDEHVAEEPSLIEKISEKFHHHDSSSSSDSEKSPKKRATPTVTSIPSPSSPPPAVITADAPPFVKSKIYRLFGRERPVHKVLGGGKPADIVLWRNKKISASVLGAATVIWILFECLEYHLLSLICHILIFALAILFLWSNATTFIHKSPPHIPDVQIPEKAVLEFANALRIEINQTLAVLREIASGKELKKFLGLIAGLWALSVVGSWFNFLTLFYILFVLLHTVPVLYEKYEDHVDAFGEKAATELKKYYAVLDERVLSKIPRGPLKDKKHA